MPFDDRPRSVHLNDYDLVRAADGELSPQQLKRIQEHLDKCLACRVRRDEIENGIAGFADLQRNNLNLPPASGARATLRARLAKAAPVSRWRPWLAYASAAAMLIAIGVWVPSVSHSETAKPAPSLTPGATRLATREDICRMKPQAPVRILPAIQRQVLDQYGLSNADPRAYEIDYLITPELGGADDIRNLWPQPYSATVWNAHVKDQLEDRLHEMVCAGTLDLGTAQHDIATDWIAAYKKYFRTDRPLSNRPD